MFLWFLRKKSGELFKNEYRVPEIIKSKALRMVNKSWKNKKTTLRKWSVIPNKSWNNRPNGVKREDWDKLVDLHDSEADKILREIGKESRKLLKALHTTGRDGIAHRRRVMEQQSPNGSVSRSVVYLATHVYKEIPQEALELMDPNCYEVKCREYVAQVRELNETEQYRDETHLDRDAVAKVFGVDDRGCVRGMGGGIPKTELIASKVPREQLRQQVLKTRAVEDRGMNGGGFQPAGSQRVILKNMRKRAVAVGYIFTNRPPIDDEFHLVLIDEICLLSESLCEGDGIFRDVSIGDKVMWPQHYVFPVTAGGDAF
ncbi:uncharacterized protein LOC113349787 [Papaver somniferum]|uniref:uncharacterized protein LOC113349787 n=1 Tax=Papaver somniferum TaxID=3469 RepID=UPI000E6F55AE|nr:uncharacterized protein LOC113349787 [Papaver somniferum]XP_026449604.1 uncharacterized protein LOC113349787 [Papaver somniferum]